MSESDGRITVRADFRLSFLVRVRERFCSSHTHGRLALASQAWDFWP